MLEKIIEFYSVASNLKNIIRTGWAEVGIPTEKIETVAEHVYGCNLLAMCIAGEYKLDLNMEKVFKMLTIKELTKAITQEISVISGNKAENSRNIILSITEKLTSKDELLEIYDEYTAQETPEAKFALYVSKFESDLQAKLYDINGDFKLENAIEDIKNYPEELKEAILPTIENASDGWLQYNRTYYNDSEIFMKLSKDLQKYKGRN